MNDGPDLGLTPEPVHQIARQKWRWRGYVTSMEGDQAVAVLRQAIETSLEVRSLKTQARNVLVARVGGVLPWAFAATEELIAIVSPAPDGCMIELSSRSTQWVWSDNGRNRRNIALVLGVMGFRAE